MNSLAKKHISRRSRLAFVSALLVGLAISGACEGGRADLRSLAPKDTILYLESPDLGMLVKSLTDNDAFRAATPSVKDLSALNGIEIAVAVTGFEASESKVTDEEAVLNFKPSFTLLAETHAWSWQVDGLVRSVLGGFVKGSYGEQAALEVSEKDGISWYVWSSREGRKAFAAVSGTKVFFGNNEEGVRKCLAIQEGKAPSLKENDRLSRQYENAGGKLAFGYVSEEGVKQLSNFAGISVALERADEADAQSVISSIFPQLIDNSISEIVWTARKTERGIEDEVVLRLEPELAEAFSEALKPASGTDTQIFDLVPADAFSVTRYNLKDPRLAFRSLIIGAAGKVNPAAARFVPALGAALLQPYGVSAPESFLASIDPFFLTLRLDPDGDEGAAIVKANNYSELERSLTDELRDGKRSSFEGSEMLVSPDGSLAVARKGEFVVLGDREGVEKCLRSAGKKAAGTVSGDLRIANLFGEARRPEHTSVTISRDRETALRLASVFGNAPSARASESFYAVRTDLDRQGILRSYVSPFGFAGSIIVQFAENP